MVTRPPSPKHPRFLDGKNEKAPIAPIDPTCLPSQLAPHACAQSSITGMLPATSMMSFIAAA